MKNIFPALACFLLTSAWSVGQSVNIPQTDWKLKYVDSYQGSSSSGEMAFDGNPFTHWHTKWGETDPLPHNIQIDLGAPYEVNGFVYVPRPDGGNGNIKKYELYLSKDGENWGTPVSAGEFRSKSEPNTLFFDAVPGTRYIKLVAISGFNGNPYYAAVAEIQIFQKSTEKPKADFSVPIPLVKTGSNVYFTDKSAVSPVSWEWRFPGGTPEISNEQNPKVSYQWSGKYPVMLKVTNLNGSTEITRNNYITVSNEVSNLALCLDGKDNDVRTGIGIIKPPWTLEASIKGDDDKWKALEVIFGGGEYSKTNVADNVPLALKNGRLHSSRLDITADTVLDNNWHHVAATCDGKNTTLYLDGKVVASAPKSVAILPGAIGINQESGSTFGGLMDEVRVWNACVSAEMIRSWMNKGLSTQHPDFRNLVGYYTFDNMQEEMDVNWVGRGHQAYHLRNCRVSYKGKAPLAYAVANTNPHFANAPVRQAFFNAVTVPSEWDVDPGTKDTQALKLRVAVTGALNPLNFTGLTLDLGETTALNDIERIRVYHTGQAARSTIKQEIFAINSPDQGKIECKIPAQKIIPLNHGINYFLVTCDISPTAKPGNTIKIEVDSFKLGNDKIIPEQSHGCVPQKVVPSSKDSPNVFRVLDWNIWHGGVHLGNEGRVRVIDLVKATNADAITMQEAYGAQAEIAKALGYHLQTASAGDNLALFSRYPLVKLPSSKTFQSNPAIVTLSGGRKVLLNSCWLRYAYRPEYTCAYFNDGMDPARWIDEDRELSTADIRGILEKDVNPRLARESMPVIIGADFNSCSHLDWTAAAAHLHHGYGPVQFPTSQYMLEQGFRDSFREQNPDEVTRPDGTFAVIYGQSQTSRIDFIYYKGTGIKSIASKIIRTAPEIDYVWASDHAAVITTFELAEENE
ncbi:MAG: discoidin domain-containing protein [Puniceicoccales bacterium]|jgi:PKD repeat protein|nr:discoidin domain-containing protein [Puniceicoccales bacterium]